MSSKCEVVITGMGIVSPLGITNQPFWDNLVAGESAVRVRPEFVDVQQPYRIAAGVLDFEPKKFVRPRKALKVMCRPIQFGFAASTQAIDQAGLSGQVDPERISTLFGTEAFYADPTEVSQVFRKCIVDRSYEHDRWGEYAMCEIEPLWMLKYLPNMVASHISIVCDARGPSNTICQAEASSLLSMIEAIDLIQRGSADAAIAGGTGSFMATTGMVYRGLDRLSRRVNHPELASRPFDAGRDGMVVGEGAGAFVLERADVAAARGATPLARILGFSRGFASRQSMSQAIAHSLTTTLNQVGMAASEVGHLNAHGVSTIEDDIIEAEGIAQAMGDVPVIAPKSSFGNLGPGSGVIELAASVNACQTGILPAILNAEQQDPRCPIHLVTENRTDTRNRTAMTLNFTAEGQVASLLISA